MEMRRQIKYKKYKGQKVVKAGEQINIGDIMKLKIHSISLANTFSAVC